VFRQARSGIFQALAESWEEFMRSPQFLEGTRQWLENAVAFRQFTNDLMAQGHNGDAAGASEGLEAIVLSVRQLETRLQDQIQQLSAKVDHLEERLDNSAAHRPAARNGAKKPKPSPASHPPAGARNGQAKAKRRSP
jgi:hypothetical protein